LKPLLNEKKAPKLRNINAKDNQSLPSTKALIFKDISWLKGSFFGGELDYLKPSLKEEKASRFRDIDAKDNQSLPSTKALIFKDISLLKGSFFFGGYDRDFSKERVRTYLMAPTPPTFLLSSHLYSVYAVLTKRKPPKFRDIDAKDNQSLPSTKADL
jgi:hypothetical protein